MTIVQAQTYLQRTMTIVKQVFTLNTNHTCSSKQVFTENTNHTYSSNRYLLRTMTILIAQTDIYWEHWPSLYLKHIFSENTDHPYSSKRYLQRTLTILKAQTGIYTEHWPSLQLKQVFTEKSVISIHSSKWKQGKTMKYHNRMGEGWWEVRKYKHDSLVTGVLSNFDFYST
jgi:hypothetical protein